MASKTGETTEAVTTKSVGLSHAVPPSEPWNASWPGGDTPADAMGAALAHELNQPLAALTIYLQSLKRLYERSGKGEPLVQELVDKATREAERAGEIVRRMRRFSARGALDRQVVNLNALADECLELSLANMTRMIEVKRNFDPSIPKIMVDPVQIRQVMVNLIKNAFDATTRVGDPRIVVTTGLRDGFAYFSVGDNGQGVRPEMVEKLFSAFESSKPQGMGLGLAISRMIAHQHNGDLVLEPSKAGEGACFGLRLPVG